ncbi:MAG TPA: RNA polymerase sigma factor [Chitinophagales bacterium]|nr:RNA polymerase sigma factor [Chitinophagales bacterium]
MNPAEYNRCVDLYSDAVFRFIYSNRKDEDEARDAVQDAFETLWRNVEKVELAKAKSYLFSVAYHDMIDNIRKQKRIEQLQEKHEYIPANRTEHYTGAKQLVEQGLERLPEIQKQVLMLRDYEGYDYKEIGNITGLNESQVKVYIFRARKTLKDFIGKTENVL